MIVAAAILHHGIVTGEKGQRHHHIIHRLYLETGKSVRGIQGFVDETGKFYDRLDAAIHAIACGQVKPGVANIQHEFNGYALYSEDLW
jgi:hypothetical protein